MQVVSGKVFAEPAADLLPHAESGDAVHGRHHGLLHDISIHKRKQDLGKPCLAVPASLEHRNDGIEDGGVDVGGLATGRQVDLGTARGVPQHGGVVLEAVARSVHVHGVSHPVVGVLDGDAGREELPRLLGRRPEAEPLGVHRRLSDLCVVALRPRNPLVVPHLVDAEVVGRSDQEPAAPVLAEHLGLGELQKGTARVGSVMAQVVGDDVSSSPPVQLVRQVDRVPPGQITGHAQRVQGQRPLGLLLEILPLDPHSLTIACLDLLGRGVVREPRGHRSVLRPRKAAHVATALHEPTLHVGDPGIDPPLRRAQHVDRRVHPAHVTGVHRGPLLPAGVRDERDPVPDVAAMDAGLVALGHPPRVRWHEHRGVDRAEPCAGVGGPRDGVPDRAVHHNELPLRGPPGLGSYLALLETERQRVAFRGRRR